VIAEAIDTALTVGWALAAWIVLTALAAALALHTVLAVVWWAGRATVRAVKAARKALSAPLSDEQPASDSSPATTAERRSEPPRRPTPSWAHTEPYTYEEAA
jgi:hypothetical protein